MFHPVGPQPPSVYWRRRLLLLGSIALLIVLLLLTVRTVTSDGSTTVGAGDPTTPAVSTPAGSPTHPRTTSAASTPHRSPTKPSSASSTAPADCRPGDLKVQAVTSKPRYRVGEQPVLELQVTNVGAEPCVQDLADKQVELRVYNGESRVWGSHDCQIEPGTNDKVLAVDTPVRVAITWSGLSSQPHCAGTRQRVGAGTYTLYALLAGRTGTAAQFVIS
jgi:hypothetical protein